MLKKITSAIFITILLSIMSVCFVKGIQMTFFPAMSIIQTALRLLVIISALFVGSMVFWYGFALILRVNIKKIITKEKDNG